jgi:adenosine 3'-phospho 5'-phosphosulfate transporter B2
MEGEAERISATSSLRGEANLADIIFKLSVNFLLYVVLIIVFYMLVRFYLEEETEYARGGNVDVSEYALLNTLDEEELEEKQKQTEAQQQTTEQQSQKKRVRLQDGKEANEDESGIELLQFEEDSKVATGSLSPPRIGGTGSLKSSKSANFLNIHEVSEEPEGTRQEVLQRLAVCSTGLIISFCIWGLVQERILTQTYDGEYFEYSYGLVFMNRLGGLILSWFLMWYFAVPFFPSPLWEYSFPSVANMLSSWCQYEALKYVSFPMVMLAKAFKIVPIMLMGKFMNNKHYETYEYVTGATVGFGLYLFLDSSEHLDFQYNVFGDAENITGAMCGVVLLLLFLIFDSFTGQWQTRMFQLNTALSPLQMMLIMNAFSCVFSFITLIHQEELSKSLFFVYEHPQMILHLVIFCLCSTVGQLFIFYTVKHFGAVVFSIIMSIRILGSTLLSCFVYSHPINEMAFLGILIVCGATAYRLLKKTEGKSLIRWKETEQSGSIFKEWHEHLDI